MAKKPTNGRTQEENQNPEEESQNVNPANEESKETSDEKE